MRRVSGRVAKIATKQTRPILLAYIDRTAQNRRLSFRKVKHQINHASRLVDIWTKTSFLSTESLPPIPHHEHSSRSLSLSSNVNILVALPNSFIERFVNLVTVKKTNNHNTNKPAKRKKITTASHTFKEQLR